jgi:lipopolysaccharide biosynthesis glycosyltransferase
MIPILTMANLGFVPGVVALLQSLEDNGNLPNNQKIIIVELEPFTEDIRDRLRDFPFGIDFRDIKEFGQVDDVAPFKWFPCTIKEHMSEWLNCIIQKLFMFKLTEYPKLLWIDCDIICLNDITEMYDMPPLSATKDAGIEIDRRVPEFGDNFMFNTGVMAFEPSLDLFNGIIEYSKEHFPSFAHVRPSGDQTMINAYYWAKQPEAVNIIEQKWNITWKIIARHPQYFYQLMDNDPKFLHFVGEKPWNVTPKRMTEITDIQAYFVKKWATVFNKAISKRRK